MKLNKEIVIYSESMRDSICEWMRFMEVDPKFPISVTFKKHKRNRSLDQNELAFKWYREISDQGYLTPQEAHEYCKLTFGIPILVHDDEDFRVFYNSVLQGLNSYESKIRAMKYIPVTSLMNTAQMSRYLDTVLEHYTNENYQLTVPIPEYAR
mgnify:FL=1